jgi:hypothetical protein
VLLQEGNPELRLRVVAAIRELCEAVESWTGDGERS